MKPVQPHSSRGNTSITTGKRKISVDRLNLVSYNEWQQKRSQIRQWLIEQIAERAIQIFQKRRNDV